MTTIASSAKRVARFCMPVSAIWEVRAPLEPVTVSPGRSSASRVKSQPPAEFAIISRRGCNNTPTCSEAGPAAPQENPANSEANNNTMQDKTQESLTAIDPITLEVIRHAAGVDRQPDRRQHQAHGVLPLHLRVQRLRRRPDRRRRRTDRAMHRRHAAVRRRLRRHGGARRACDLRQASACTTATSCCAITPPCRASTSTTP